MRTLLALEKSRYVGTPCASNLGGMVSANSRACQLTGATTVALSCNFAAIPARAQPAAQNSSGGSRKGCCLIISNKFVGCVHGTGDQCMLCTPTDTARILLRCGKLCDGLARRGPQLWLPSRRAKQFKRRSSKPHIMNSTMTNPCYLV